MTSTGTSADTIKKHSLGKARRLRRLLSADGHFCIVALDQRAVLSRMLAEIKLIDESAVPFEDLLAVKRLLVEALSHNASAMLFDPNIAVPAALDILPRDTGLLVSLEHHRVEESPYGRKTASIPDWSVEKIQLLGADGVKVLIWYHPDADISVRAHQQEYVRTIGQQCANSELPFVLELLAYQPPSPSDTDVIPVFDTAMELPRVVLASVEEFVKPEYQVDLLKLESPVPVATLNNDPLTDATITSGVDVQQSFNAIGACCIKAQIPWVMLSAGVTTTQFVAVLKHAYKAGAQGFLAGRAIWKKPLQSFPDLSVCQANLNEQGVEALDQLLNVTKLQAQNYQVFDKAAPKVELEGDFASWYSKPN